MRITEDARQEALLALYERGGPSSVRNPEAWLARHARVAAIEAVRHSVHEEAAWCERVGVYDSLAHGVLEGWQEAKREGCRARYASLSPERKAARLEQTNAARRRRMTDPAKREAWNAYKRALRAAQKKAQAA